MYAARNGNDTLVSLLLQHGADINAQGNEATALKWAVEKDRLSTVELLLAKGADATLVGSEKETADHTKWPLLGWAALDGYVDMVKLLLKHGIAVNQPASNGITPLMLAARKGHTDVMDILLANGASIDLQDPVYGYTALTYAISWDQTKAADFFIKHGAGLNIPMKTGATAIILAAQRNDSDIVTDLIKAKADLNAVDHDGQTALMNACEHNHYGIKEDSIRELVEAGANIDIVDKKGETALTYAGDRANGGVVDYLKGKGAKRTDLHIILKSDSTKPLAPARAWALGIAAIYMQENGESTDLLGGYSDQERSDYVDTAKEMLAKDWNIKNKPDLLYQLEWLKNTGHRTSYLVFGQSLTGKSDAEFQKYISNPVFTADQVEEAKKLRAGYAKWKDRLGLAWDFCRYINLVSESFTAGYVNETEAWALIMPVAQETQKDFTSWQEMGQNFLDGRSIWSGERDPHFDSAYQLLANPNDPNSPWNKHPWNCDLSQPSATPTASVH